MGWPLWETEMHDILKAAFPELQLIFLYYCGSSIAGSGSMSSATRIGLQVRGRGRVKVRVRKDQGQTPTL